MEAGGDKSLIKGFHGAKDAETCLTCHDVTTEHLPTATASTAPRES